MIQAHKSTFVSLQQRDKVSQNSSQLLSTLRANDCVTKFVPPHSPPNSNNSSRMTKDIDIHLLQNKLNGRLKGKGRVQRAPDLNIINNQIHQETNAANSCAASEGCQYEYSVALHSNALNKIDRGFLSDHQMLVRAMITQPLVACCYRDSKCTSAFCYFVRHCFFLASWVF